MTRKAKLEKALAFDEGTLETSNDVTARGKWSYPRANARLAPLHAALIEAVGALEYAYKYSNEPVIFGKAQEAIAKIDEALEGMGGV